MMPIHGVRVPQPPRWEFVIDSKLPPAPESFKNYDAVAFEEPSYTLSIKYHGNVIFTADLMHGWMDVGGMMQFREAWDKLNEDDEE